MRTIPQKYVYGAEIGPLGQELCKQEVTGSIPVGSIVVTSCIAVR